MNHAAAPATRVGVIAELEQALLFVAQQDVLALRVAGRMTSPPPWAPLGVLGVAQHAERAMLVVALGRARSHWVVTERMGEPMALAGLVPRASGEFPAHDDGVEWQGRTVPALDWQRLVDVLLGSTTR